MNKLIIAAILLAVSYGLFAQTGADSSAGQNQLDEKVTVISGKLGGLEEAFLETKSTVDKLAKIKFSGYVQAQYRMVMDTAGNMDNLGKYRAAVGGSSGGAFADGIRSQFHVRRGRLKLTYDQPLTMAVVQLDAIQSGVSIKDAYLALKEPWLKSASLKMGLFDRPFGFEIMYSSSSRESPERSRLFQTLFPGERDVGAMLDVAPAEKYGLLSKFNLKGGLFNGNGIANENDDNKDFIGRLGVALPFTDINMALDAGASLYMGKVRCNDTTSALAGARGFSYAIMDKKFKKSDSAEGRINKDFDRKYTGVDLQLYYDVPVIGGTSLRGEYLFGVQPGISSSSSAYNAARNTATPIYVRNFSGYYLSLIQNVGLKNQLVLKYDNYDPNTDVEGADLTNNPATKLSNTDLAYTTLGVGWIFHWDENLKFVLYYENIKNEEAAFDANSTNSTEKALAIYNTDVNDDVLTVRLQYKF